MSAFHRLLTELSADLADFESEGLRRRLTTVESIDGPLVRINGRDAICWCSNDYLGLSQHPVLIQAAARAASDWGLGARASRLLAGTTTWHNRLEEALASWFGAEAGMVYPTGYQTNLGTLEALLSLEDTVFVDRLAHASLIDAARASRARLRVFAHNDLAHLAALLVRETGRRRRLIVTEGVFSMDGDCAPLGELLEVARAHQVLVYLDDAHGAFAMGPTGRGTPEAAGVPAGDFLYMGTLGKALGCQGGFVVGPRTLIEYLQNRARTFVYTTALAVPIAAAAVAALELLARDPTPRAQLQDRVAQVADRLRWLDGWPVGFGSHIVPVMIGSTEAARELSRQLWERGIWAPAIRPPTVAAGTARLRLSVTALHTDAHIDALAEALHELLPQKRRALVGTFPAHKVPGIS